MHPKTGKVCVPIDPAAAFKFDPDTVPTVHTLLAELPAKAAGKVGWASKAVCISEAEQSFLCAFLRVRKEGGVEVCGCGQCVLQGTEEWQDTSMAASVQLFEKGFLDACGKSNKVQLTNLTRAVAAAPTLAF